MHFCFIIVAKRSPLHPHVEVDKHRIPITIEMRAPGDYAHEAAL